MICLHCNSEKFARKENALIEQAFRGETFMVKAPAMVCTKCGWQALAEGMADELLKSTGDAYRQRHGLLTSVEIKAIREDLGMSQQQFAEALGAGVASVKRWETWLPQETSSDQLIRLKTKELKRNLQTGWVNTPEWDLVCKVGSGIQLVQMKFTPVVQWETLSAVKRQNKPVKVSRRYDTALALAA